MKWTNSLGFLFCIGLSAIHLNAQNKPNYYFDVLGEVSAGLIVPSPLGSHYVAEGYDLDPGFQLSGLVRIESKLSLGADFQFYYGRVTDREITGGFDGTSFRRFMAVGQYNLLNERSDLALQAGVHLGIALLRNKIGTESFQDDGYSTGASLDLSYRFSTTFGVFARGLLLRDWMNIQTVSEIQGQFKRIDYFLPSAGLRLYIR